MKMLYLPKGTHRIHAEFSGPASRYKQIEIEFYVRVKKSAVKSLTRSLAESDANLPMQGPYIDSDGMKKKSAGFNPRFEWSDRGVELYFDPDTGADFSGKYMGANFMCDADYKRAKMDGDKMIFRKGLRGSKSNPAEVTGCDFVVAHLTEHPSFKKLIK